VRTTVCPDRSLLNRRTGEWPARWKAPQTSGLHAGLARWSVPVHPDQQRLLHGDL